MARPVATETLPEFFDEDAMRYFNQFEETLGDKKHRVLNDDDRSAFVTPMLEFQDHRDNCGYTVEGVTCKVPKATTS